MITKILKCINDVEAEMEKEFKKAKFFSIRISLDDGELDDLSALTIVTSPKDMPKIIKALKKAYS